jgi:drug/metabolite transporter (DMT)-like permease
VTAGFVLGLAAAIAFAGADLLAAHVARRVGSLPALAGSLCVSGAAFVVLGVVTQLRFPADPAWFFRMVMLGVLFAASYLTLFYALSVGPLSVVGPITAIYGPVTVLLAVVLLGERPGLLQMAAVPLAALGSILAAVINDPQRQRIRVVGPGPVFAVIAVVSSAAVTVWLQDEVREGGWVQAVIVLRLTGLTLAWLALLAAWLRHARGPMAAAREPRLEDRKRKSSPLTDALLGPRHAGFTPTVAALMGAIGLCDAIGLSALAHGLQVAPAWLVGLVTSTSPVFVTLVALLVLGERLRRSQWAGVGLVALSMAAVVVDRG